MLTCCYVYTDKTYKTGKIKEMVSEDRGAEGNKAEPVESRWEGAESLAKHWRGNYIRRNLLESVKVITSMPKRDQIQIETDRGKRE